MESHERASDLVIAEQDFEVVPDIADLPVDELMRQCGGAVLGLAVQRAVQESGERECNLAAHGSSPIHPGKQK